MARANTVHARLGLSASPSASEFAQSTDLTLARCKRAMIVPERMRYGGGRQDKAVRSGWRIIPP